MKRERPVFNVSSYFSKFTLFFGDNVSFLEEVEKISYDKSFDTVSTEFLQRAFSLYRETTMLCSACNGSDVIATDARLRNLPIIRSKLSLFTDSYCDACFANCLAGKEPTNDTRSILKEFLAFRQAEKRKMRSLRFATHLYADFQAACTDESDMMLFLMLCPPKMGCPDETTISLEWTEFALDKCGDQYVVSEYSVSDGLHSYVGAQEFSSKTQAFDSLKFMARKYYVCVFSVASTC
jgi:hypothetical protein